MPQQVGMYLNCSRLVVSLHYIFDGVQKGTSAQGWPSWSFSPLNASSLKRYLLWQCHTAGIVTRITVAPSRFSASTTSRLVRPLPFKETVLCLAYLDRFTMVCRSQLHPNVGGKNVCTVYTHVELWNWHGIPLPR